MKKLFVMGLLSLIPLTFIAQEEWELPIKNDLVCFEYKKDFNNKKDLCSYYTAVMFKMDLESKYRALLSNKGGNFISNTDYFSVFMLDGAGQTNPSKFMQCNSNGNDTLNGWLQIIISKPMKFGGLTGSYNSIKTNFRIVFTDHSYNIKFRGFVIGSSRVSVTKGTIANSEQYLEDIYKNFLKEDNKKSKAEKAFYIDLKMLINLFELTLGDLLERNIKVAEAD